MRRSSRLPLVLLGAVLAGCTGCLEHPAGDAAAVLAGTADQGAAPPAPADPLALVPPHRDGSFAETIGYGERQLVRNGSALCEWGIFGIDLYRIALYVERRPTSVAEALAAEQVMVFHLEFVRGLSDRQLRDAYTGSVEANTGAEIARVGPALDRLLATLRPVEAGECYTFVLDPARGLLVQRGGETLACIEDAGFRRLFARLYLGDLPPTAAVREGLLGEVPR